MSAAIRHRFDPAAHLARMISTYGCPNQAVVAMLWAYFDETIVGEVSGNDGKIRPTEMFVGGCVATDEKWEKFSRQWKRALNSAGVNVFHANDFYAFHGEFRWFDRNGNRDMKRHGRLRDKLADIILDYVDELIVFTSMVPIRDKGTQKAYEDAALRALYDATKFRVSDSDSLYIVLARHPELSPWSILKKFENIDWEKKLAGCGVFQPKDVMPLQAADFVLHSLNKRWQGAQTASFARLSEGCKKRNIPFQQQVGSTTDMDELLASISSGGRPS